MSWKIQNSETKKFQPPPGFEPEPPALYRRTPQTTSPRTLIVRDEVRNQKGASSPTVYITMLSVSIYINYVMSLRFILSFTHDRNHILDIYIFFLN